MVIEHELTAAQLCDAYERGQRLFTGVELVSTSEYPSLLNVKLCGVEFADCWFHSTEFSNVDLSHTKFSRCNLKCCTFTNCDLRNTKWVDCPVCSVAIAASVATGIAVSGLDAYGAPIESSAAFLEYASSNSVRRRSQ